LDFLKDRGDLLYCVSAGDPKVKEKKYRAYGLGRWFDEEHFRVVPWEKLPELQRIRGLHPDIAGYMVGDSIGSDLVPAKEAGFTPVWVPSQAVWDHGELVKDLPEGTIKLEQIGDLLRLIPSRLV